MIRRMATGVSLALAVTLVAGGCTETDPGTPMDDGPTMQLLTPNGGTAVAPGSVLSITWSATDDIAVASVDLSYIARGLSAAVPIASGVTAASYDWTVPGENMFTVRVIAVATDSAGQTAADTSDALFAIVAATDNGFVTSQACATCHPFHVEEVFASGHPYKLNQVVDGQPPTYPHSTVPNPPAGFTWNDITYVIGGYGWKARFMNDSGYIITDGIDGVNAQFNLPRPDLGVGAGLPAEWVAYQAADTQRKPYNCGACHTTGWQSLADNGGVHQDGLVGIEGTWAETGITCEACHGAGVTHVVTQHADDITVDTSAELCGNCHTRDASRVPRASGGFIQHHEQYDEMLQAGHSAQTCGSCHAPHIGTRYGNAAAGGIVATCESCHADVTTNSHLIDLSCETCHMSRATRSARSVNPFEGDVRTHIFAINPNPFPRDSMFYVDATSGNTFTRGFVTLDMACYQCHKDPATGGGGFNSTRTLAELSARAMGIHD